MNNKQRALIDAAKSGKISDMYGLISDGGDPFYFDENSRNALDYAVKSDPIKAFSLINELAQVCTSPARQQILQYYLKLAVSNGGDCEE
jgi:hypothetical protein